MSSLSLDKHEVHIWHAALVLTPEQEEAQRRLLSTDEIKRADRFRFAMHRQRYIAARSLLRRVLGRYLDVDPATIHFSYADHGKPYLDQVSLQFNLSHSDEMAVIALTEEYPIGVDIEKISTTYNDAVAKRFFSESEYSQLIELPPDQRITAFYRIWSRKEAIIKALGEGLRFPLSQFSVSIKTEIESIVLDHHGMTTWHLESFTVHPAYQSAFATRQSVNKVIVGEWNKAM